MARAADLGHTMVYTNIGYCYEFGMGVEVDKEKAIHYYELGAMGGDSMARHNLGNTDAFVGDMDRALKHYMIAVRGGRSETLNQINGGCIKTGM